MSANFRWWWIHISCNFHHNMANTDSKYDHKCYCLAVLIQLSYTSSKVPYWVVWKVLRKIIFRCWLEIFIVSHLYNIPESLSPGPRVTNYFWATVVCISHCNTDNYSQMDLHQPFSLSLPHFPPALVVKLMLLSLHKWSYRAWQRTPCGTNYTVNWPKQPRKGGISSLENYAAAFMRGRRLWFRGVIV